MPNDRSRNVSTAARTVGAAWTLLTDAETVCYATGFAPVAEVGPSPFAGGPAVALVDPDGTTTLLVTNLEQAAAEASEADGVITYVGYSYDRQQPVAEHYQQALSKMLTGHRLQGVVAAEHRSLPATALLALADHDATPVEISPVLDRLRAIKTEAEIEKLRRASELSDLGHRVALEATTPGLTELDVFGRLRGAWEERAGERVPVTGDFISGTHRTAAVGGWPQSRAFREGDLVIADLAPRRDGYWSDSCNTYAVGQASAAARRMHRIVSDALQAGIAELRPGARACDIDQRMRAVVGAAGHHYPHHSGHGIGTSVHEYPRLVPQETAVLRPGMVLLLEPGAYTPDVGGIRLEWMFLVRDDGAELISKFDHNLEP